MNPPMEQSLKDYWDKSQFFRGLPSEEHRKSYRESVLIPQRDATVEPFRRKLWDKLCA